MEQKGQISIEFVLIIGLMLVIVLAIAGYAGYANENNAIAAAAREGATNASSNIVLLNRSMVPIKVEDISLIGSGHNLTIQIDISGTISSSQNKTIVDSTLNSIVAQGYIRVNNTNSSNSPYADYIVAKWHNYNITLV